MNVHEGRVFGLTGERFPGSRLEVVTRDGRAEIVGTAFAVESRHDAPREFSCFCVSEGTVRVVEGAEHEHSVGAHSTLFMDVTGSGRSPYRVHPFPSEPNPHTRPLLDFTAEGMLSY